VTAVETLIDHLEHRAAEFWDTVQGQTPRGQRYNTGRVTGRDGYDEGLRLYRLLRELRPRVSVETGVCNGVSTAFLLLALEDNEAGDLYSIDLPEVAGEEYEPGTFWDGKGGVLVADDVNVNAAWDEFARKVGREPETLGPKLAMITK
jgi:hypothetical protein